MNSISSLGNGIDVISRCLDIKKSYPWGDISFPYYFCHSVEMLFCLLEIFKSQERDILFCQTELLGQRNDLISICFFARHILRKRFLPEMSKRQKEKKMFIGIQFFQGKVLFYWQIRLDKFASLHYSHTPFDICKRQIRNILL